MLPVAPRAGVITQVVKANTITMKIDRPVFWTTLSMVIRPTSAPVWVGVPVLQVDGSVVP